ncbi:MAG TPA: cytochrome c maturation protein CcmE [Polyangiaceae bacterium]
MPSRLDDELERAIADSEAEAEMRPEVPAAEVPIAAAPSGDSKRNIGLLVALLAMVGSILTLVMTSFDDAAIYSKGVDALMKDKDRLSSRTVRVEGALINGTLKRRMEPCEYRFTIRGDDSELAVRYPQCIIPDTVRDVPGMMVTVEGKLSEAGHLEATNVIGKCPSKYEMEQRAARGEKMPHDPLLGPQSALPAPANEPVKN